MKRLEVALFTALAMLLPYAARADCSDRWVACRKAARNERTECVAACDRSNAACKKDCNDALQASYQDCDDAKDECEASAFSRPDGRKPHDYQPPRPNNVPARACYTQYGSCPMVALVPVGYPCQCFTSVGPIAGIAR